MTGGWGINKCQAKQSERPAAIKTQTQQSKEILQVWWTQFYSIYKSIEGSTTNTSKVNPTSEISKRYKVSSNLSGDGLPKTERKIKKEKIASMKKKKKKLKKKKNDPELG